MKKNSGQALITAIIFFLFISTTITLGVINPVLHQLSISNDLVRSKNSYFLSESLSEDIIYRLKTSKQVGANESLTLNNETATAVVSDILGGKSIVATGDFSDSIRKIKTDLVFGSGVSFHYGIQAGEGGFSLDNSSSITGNAFSNGPISGSGNTISGDVISAGGSGLIVNIRVGGSAYAHSITNSIITGNAYYQSISGTTVGGISYPSSPDQDIGEMPIPDSQIKDWKTAAKNGGEVSCSGGKYQTSSSETIGYKKIPCDLNIAGDNITLTGPLWVEGNVNISNTSKIYVSSSLSGKTIPIIADKEDNRTTSSKVDLANSSKFFGSGANSYVLLISQNNSAENSGGETAISITNTVTGDILVYAGHGKIDIANSVNLKEVSAYKIGIRNTAEVIYEIGLANLLFSAGPGGGYTINEWKEIE
ncbi:MAG: hypothetical protein WC673_02480 [Candidatus Paceibacterota bacterium]|jgi:hypothetical protein